MPLYETPKVHSTRSHHAPPPPAQRAAVRTTRVRAAGRMATARMRCGADCHSCACVRAWRERWRATGGSIVSATLARLFICLFICLFVCLLQSGCCGGPSRCGHVLALGRTVSPSCTSSATSCCSGTRPDRLRWNATDSDAARRAARRKRTGCNAARAKRYNRRSCTLSLLQRPDRDGPPI